MKTSTALAVFTAALSVGCAAAPSYAPPEAASFNLSSAARIDVGALSAGEVLSTLPNTLARHGYFVIKTEQLAPGRYKLLTDWRASAGNAERTRLVLDLHRRGSGYALSIESMRAVEDASGAWQAASPTSEMVQQVRAIERDFTLRSR